MVSAVYLSGMCQTAAIEQNVYLLCILCVSAFVLWVLTAAVSVHIPRKIKERLQLGWSLMFMQILIITLQPANQLQTVVIYSAFQVTIDWSSELNLVSLPLHT